MRTLAAARARNRSESSRFPRRGAPHAVPVPVTTARWEVHMSKRPISASQLGWLRTELGAWRDAGAIDDPERVLALYETEADIADRAHSRGVFALMAVAGALVALAVLLLVGYNWGEMPRALKVSGAVLGTLAAHAAAFGLRYRRDSRTGSEVMFFVGCLLYGAAVWQIAQAFHINAHYPDGLFWWAVGVLPFALLLDTVLLHVLLSAVLAVWVGTEIIGFRDLGGWLFGRHPGVPNCAASLPLFVAVGAWWSYRKNSPAALALYAPLLAWWLILQPFAWKLDTNPVFLIGGAGAVLLLLAESHKSGSLFAIPLRLWGFALAGGALIPLGSYDFNRYDVRAEATPFALAVPALLVALVAAALGAAWLFRRRGGEVDAPLLERRYAVPLALAALFAGLAQWYAAGVGEHTGAVVPTVLANAAMLAAGVWLVGVGLREERRRPFGYGVAYLMLWAVVRYFDLFGGAGGMLGAAALFMLCGGVLFGVAQYWRKRKEVRHA
jgi:uncharacterized membrane protein